MRQADKQPDMESFERMPYRPTARSARLMKPTALKKEARIFFGIFHAMDPAQRSHKADLAASSSRIVRHSMDSLGHGVESKANTLSAL